MQQGLLAYNGILAGAWQRDVRHIALDHADAFFEPNKPRQLRRARDAGGRKLDTGDKGTILMREIACRSAQAGAEVDDFGATANVRTSSQRIICMDAAVVVLIVGKQLFRAHSVEAAALCLQLAKNDLRGDWMAVIKINR